MKLPFTHPFAMKTRLAAAAVERRLRDATAAPWSLTSRSDYPVAGRGYRGVWTLCARPGPFSRNGVRRVLETKCTGGQWAGDSAAAISDER